MIQPIRSHANMLAGGTIIIVAILHIAHPRIGLPRLLEYLMFQLPLLDPRPLVFTISGIGLIIGVLLAWNGLLSTRAAYLAGMAMMVIYLVGYVGWHLTGHGGFWPYIERHHHGGNPVVLIYNHLMADNWELVTKALELLSLGLLAIAYHERFSTSEELS